ncbi:unnamed protein product [Protopolystoma xenopodis]|uniref:ubiquitinyl hydrolase 1 n=1 Tax=Protopolystoma xenopodis TaxID=117903 RepID=A0A3S5C2J5_9PLAT|nr:unnamed protein product [Protopolystoma xenopodis]
MAQISANGTLPLSYATANNPVAGLTPLGLTASPLAYSLRVEEVPLNELNLGPDECVIHVAHFDKDIHSTFGVPFTVFLHDKEPYSVLRERIRKRLEVPEKEFERWGLVIFFQTGGINLPMDDHLEVPIDMFSKSSRRAWIGIDHKPSKRPRYAPSEKPIKIHN